MRTKPPTRRDLVRQNAELRAELADSKTARASQGAATSATDASLRVSEIRYRRLFEAAQDGVLLVDPVTRKIVDANPFMTQLLGFPLAHLVGKELFEIGLLVNEAASQDMFSKLQSEHHVRYDNLPLLSQNGRHQQVEVVANLYDENGLPIIQFNIRDITERKLADEHNKLMMAEVNHRSMNLLAVVQSVIYQTARKGDPSDFMTRLVERIQGLAASQDLFVKSHWRGVEVIDLVGAQLAYFKDLIGTRVRFEGPVVRLKPAAAQGIGMALHELATNAAKYGALSNLTGIVRVSWKILNGGTPVLSLSWIEEGGPPVIAPTRKGFGQLVIGPMVEASVQGTSTLSYPADGFRWLLLAPVRDTLIEGQPKIAKS